MVKLKEPIVYFDVDDTLVSWEHGDFYREGTVEFTCPHNQATLYLEVITEHLEAIKAHKLRGHTVVVWSAGGACWAEEVVKTLGLTKFVDACASKPNWFYDDIPARQFMPEENRRHNRLLRKTQNEDD